MRKWDGRAAMSLASTLLLSAGLAMRGHSAETAARGGVVRLAPAMFVIERGANLRQPTLMQSLSLDPVNPDGLPPLPAAQFRSAAAELLAQGPVVAVRGENGIAVLPQRVKAGAKAALIPLAGKEGVKTISLMRGVAAKVREALDKEDAGSAQRILAKAFDAAGAPEESPVAPSWEERQRAQAENYLTMFDIGIGVKVPRKDAKWVRGLYNALGEEDRRRFVNAIKKEVKDHLKMHVANAYGELVDIRTWAGRLGKKAPEVFDYTKVREYERRFSSRKRSFVAGTDILQDGGYLHQLDEGGYQPIDRKAWINALSHDLREQLLHKYTNKLR